MGERCKMQVVAPFGVSNEQQVHLFDSNETIMKLRKCILYLK